MRRSDREITSFDEQVAIMRECDVCRLAISGEEYPYILPLNFGLEIVDGHAVLYFHGATEGTKYDLLRKNPRVSFELDCAHELVLKEESCHCTMKYRSVIGRGVISFVEEEADKLHALDCLMEHYRPGFRYSHAAVPRTTVLKLTVEHMTGKER